MGKAVIIKTAMYASLQYNSLFLFQFCAFVTKLLHRTALTKEILISS